ncbi:MAG: NERD domain-containing protein [Parasphingorhabdus sp.]|uniref:NERD domain-containing protein n=1 Tax=Parasphingorhabdus sp. TaxID=2709688 RepID=UPI00300248EA
MTLCTTSTRLFLGNPISNAAEAACVRRLLQDFQEAGVDAVILANFTLGPKRRQIDLLVATQETAIVIEIKAYIHPVYGNVNGSWSLQLDSGDRKELGNTNPYQQALENRFTVTDSLRDSDGLDVKEAVGGMLCLYPEASPGSTIPKGDFKLAIGGYGDLISLLKVPRTNALSLARWIAFAQSHGLNDQFKNPITAAKMTITQYQAAYQDLGWATLGPYIEPLFDGEQSTEELGTRSANGEQLQIIGPSGSGKTELLKRLGMACAKRGNLPVLIRARDFDREIGPLLRADTARYTSETVPALFTAAAAAGAEIILHIDAINDCPADRRADLIAALQAMRINYGVRIVLTGQEESTLPTSLCGALVSLKQPDAAQAQCLVEAHLGRALSEHEVSALEVVATAHDAAILAAMLSETNTIDGRFSLYHSFTRARLKAAATPQADRGLADLATAMRTGFISTMTKASAERIVDPNSGATISAVTAAGLLWSEGNRIGFRHDLLGDFFAAEAVLRRAVNPAELNMLVRLPIHAELREFILGGCTTTQEIDMLLSNSPDLRLLRSALSGRAGSKAKDYVISRMLDLIAQLKRNYQKIELALPEDATSASGLSSLVPNFPETGDDQAIDKLYLDLIPFGLGDGILPDLIELFASTDQHLIAEADRLREENKDFRLAWRAAAFGTVYGMHLHPAPRHLQNLLQAIQNNRFQQSEEGVLLKQTEQLDAFENLSVGLLFLRLSILRLSPKEPMPARFPELLQQVWTSQVYHLRLLICDIIRFRGRDLEETDRTAVREMLNEHLSNSNIWLNSIVIDALEGVDGIEHDFTVESAVDEYEEMLTLPETPENCSLAVSAVTRTYDHPFRDQYWEAFYEALAVEKRQALLLRGLRDRPGDPWFISDILRALRRDPTPDAEQELQRLAAGPLLHGHSHQYAILAFAEAIALLATLGLPLNVTEPVPDTLAMRAWYEAAPLIHVLNGGDATPSVDTFVACGFAEAFDVVQRLHREARNIGLGEHVEIRFETYWPNMVHQLVREVLAKGYVAVSVFDRGHFGNSLNADHIDVALQLMARVGRATDINLVSFWLDHPVYGEQALATARVLEVKQAESTTSH